MCTIQFFFFFGIFTVLCNHPHYLIPEYLYHPNKKPHTCHQSLPIPRQPLIYFLSLWICLFWTFCVNGTIQYVILMFANVGAK